MAVPTLETQGRYFKHEWQEPGFYAEILFEQEFIPHYPWGEVPIYSASADQPVSMLCHVTHQSQAQSIRQSLRMNERNEYIFVSRPKKGKSGYCVTDGSPLGESYRCNLNGFVPDGNTSYTEVNSDEHLLPVGQYSWWGVEPVIESRYGSCKFSVNFKKILLAFQKSHRKHAYAQKPSLIFRKAGTLRYRKEICYVILVHASTDDDQHIRHLPLLTSTALTLEFHGLLNDQGVVTNWKANDPVFKKKILQCNYENVAFGFYFSSVEGQLRIAQEDVACNPVTHPRQSCIRKQKERGAWLCPDDV